MRKYREGRREREGEEKGKGRGNLAPTVISKSRLLICVCEVNQQNQTVNDGVAHSKNPRKCAYHVTFELDLDLEHTLDAS